MSLETNPRFRINADQGRDNRWSFNATVEYKDYQIQISNNPEDPADTVTEPLGLKLLSMVKEAENAFRDDGRVLISDGNLQALSPPKSYNKQKAESWYIDQLNKLEDQLEGIKGNFAAFKLTGKSKTTKKS